MSASTPEASTATYHAHAGPCRVAYTVPAGWEIHHPSGATRVDATTWEYPSYEILLDTPVVLGRFDRITRRVRGTDFHHVFLTRGVGFATEAEPFDLDAALRATADDSLDRAFRAFYAEYAGRGAGYTVADVVRFFEAIRPGLGAQVAREAEAPAALSLVEQLERLGFRVGRAEAPYAGLILAGDTGPAIASVLDGSPAGRSGLAAEDVITTVEGYPFSRTALRWVIAHQATLELGVLRGNQPRTYQLELGRRARIASLAWVGTSEQAARIAAWLGQPFAPAAGALVPLDFYEDFHGIEAVR